MTNIMAVMMITNIAFAVWTNEPTSKFTSIGGLDEEFSVQWSCYDLEIPTNAVTVTVSTNVVVGDNSYSLCPICSGVNGWTWQNTSGVIHECRGRSDPTERTETTIVTEFTTLRVWWKGQWREWQESRELSRTVKKWVKEENWVVVGGD